MAARVVLIGLRASGKTTVGRELAERLGVPFLDSDEHVLARTGRSPAQWISEDGEAAFREVECQSIAELARVDAGVLAAGGGVPCSSANREALGDWSTVLLMAPLPVLVERISAATTDRPSLTDRPLADEIAFLGMKRQDDYLSMRPVVMAETDVAVADVVDTITAALTAR